MHAVETAARLAAFEGRGAGTDAERRAAGWIAGQLGSSGRQIRLEPFWCRPNWAAAQAWHVALGLAGSLVSVGSPRLGGALVLAALLFVLADDRLGFSPGRRLTLERASQNVVAIKPPGWNQHADKPLHLIVTANYDAGRAGLVYRDRLRGPCSRVSEKLGGLTPGWLGWLSIALVWVLLTAILRLEGEKGTAIGVLQLVPTVGLVLALALLLELASSGYAPAASDNASGVGAAVALVGALDAAPPRNATVELVLQGAGDGSGTGLRRYLKRHRHIYRRDNTAVLGVAGCGAGSLRWWTSDGQLIPLRYFPPLRRMCEELQIDNAAPRAAPHKGRGATPAFPARSARLPAIAIGALDQNGMPPRSHQLSDTAARLDSPTLDATVGLGLMLVDKIDAYLRDQPSRRRHRIALRRPLTVLAGRQRQPPDQLRA